VKGGAWSGRQKPRREKSGGISRFRETGADAKNGPPDLQTLEWERVMTFAWKITGRTISRFSETGIPANNLF
jgi:hypothetical protein